MQLGCFRLQLAGKDLLADGAVVGGAHRLVYVDCMSEGGPRPTEANQCWGQLKKKAQTEESCWTKYLPSVRSFRLFKATVFTSILNSTLTGVVPAREMCLVAFLNILFSSDP